MKPHALYVGPLKSLHSLVRCECGEVISDGCDWCSDTCAEAHHKGDLRHKEPCTCRPFEIPHDFLCPRYVPHPEHYTHPLENA